MKHRAAPDFWRHYRKLPRGVRVVADRSFQLLLDDPRHPSLHLKQVGRLWSVRVGQRYRALGVQSTDSIVWFWIAAHPTPGVRRFADPYLPAAIRDRLARRVLLQRKQDLLLGELGLLHGRLSSPKKDGRSTLLQ